MLSVLQRQILVPGFYDRYLQERGCRHCGQMVFDLLAESELGIIVRCWSCRRQCIARKRDGHYHSVNAHFRVEMMTLPPHDDVEVTWNPVGLLGEFVGFVAIGIEHLSAPCFVCGEIVDKQGGVHRQCLSGHVEDVETAHHIVDAFFGGSYWATADYREKDLQNPRVIIGACPNHVANLYWLYELVGDGKINQDRVAAAKHLAFVT